MRKLPRQTSHEDAGRKVKRKTSVPLTQEVSEEEDGGIEDDFEMTQHPVGQQSLQRLTVEVSVLWNKLLTQCKEKENLVSSTVRFILFREAQRLPVKRAEILKHVLANHKELKITSAITELAKQRLQDTFGMELVEVPHISVNKEGRKISMYTTISSSMCRKN